MLNINKYHKMFGLGILPRIIPVFFILILSFNNTQAQENLVPNGSFEEYDTCPNGTAQFDAVKDWYNPTLASPDYYNACANNGAGVPDNDWGWQQANDGSGYAGFIIEVPDSLNNNNPYYREYIQVKLKNPLEKEKLYCWNIYVSLIDENDYASNNISLAFTKDSVSLNSEFILGLNPFFKTTKIITDSVSWTKLSGEYMAIGGEKFLTIGNFSEVSSAEIVKLNDNSLGGASSYYYIDNVFVGKCVTQVSFPNVFTPNNDGINDFFKPILNGVRDYQLSVLNRWGNLVFYTEDTSIVWDGRFQNKYCSDGVYFYKCIYTDESQQKIEKTGFVHLIR